MQTNKQAKKFKSKFNVYKKPNDAKFKGDHEKKFMKKNFKKKFHSIKKKNTEIKTEEASVNLKTKPKFKPKFKKPGDHRQFNKKEQYSKADDTTDISKERKNSLKRKISVEDDKIPNKKIKLEQLKKKERKLFRQKKKKNTETFERSKQLKLMWEELRKVDCEQNKKIELLERTYKLIKGHIKELCFAHDTVRVLECAFDLGNKLQKEMLFEEIKDSIIPLAKSKYAKFLLLKILRKGSKEQKSKIITEMHSNVISLISHSEAAEIVELAFNEFASSSERIQLSQEFYGSSFKYFKDSNVSLKQLLENEPDKKSTVIQHMKEALIKCFQKTVIKHSFIHYVLREFIVHADAQSRAEVIESVRHVLIEMLHTKDGARATMHCVWHGTKKDRKVIVKSFKTHVVKVAQEEHGHLVLLSIFDSVDDTNLVKKVIISELLKDIPSVAKSLHGRKVLLYLISPRDPVHFCPDVIKILQEGDNNKTSIKDAFLRRTELKEAVAEHLVKFVAANTSDAYKDNSVCLATATILRNAKGHCSEAFNSIAKLVAMPYSIDVKNTHFIESPGSSFMLKKLTMEEKNFDFSKFHDSFSMALIQHASPDIIKSWTECNRGCFLLVSLMETEIKAVIDAVKTALHGFHNQLSKKKFPGATVLLKKIKG